MMKSLGNLPQQFNISRPIPVRANRQPCQEILLNLGISPTKGEKNPLLSVGSPPRECTNPILKNPQFRNIIPDKHFFVACAIHKSSGIYTFDIYDSETRIWTYDEAEVNLGGDHTVLRNSGVSCSESAYWLTSGKDVVAHDPKTRRTRTVSYDKVPLKIDCDTKMQLGRVGKQVGLVVVDGWLARVFLLNDWKWSLYSRTIVEVDEGNDVADDDINEIMRFETDDCRVEVVFCVGERRRLAVWESVNSRSVREVELEGSENVAAALANDNAIMVVSLL